jgi:hypothetical protein
MKKLPESFTFRGVLLVLVDQYLLIGADALAEYPVAPALADQRDM